MILPLLSPGLSFFSNILITGMLTFIDAIIYGFLMSPVIKKDLKILPAPLSENSKDLTDIYQEQIKFFNALQPVARKKYQEEPDKKLMELFFLKLVNHFENLKFTPTRDSTF